ncbi:hypothetical protein J6Z39_03535 [bacterium]|nr:hypothetical protein [bacterium]
MYRFWCTIFILVLSLSCNEIKKDDVVYIFKGEVVSVPDFRLKYNLWLRQNNLPDSLEMRKNYLFIELTGQLLYDKGKNEGVDNIPEIWQKIENYKRKTVVEYMEKKLKEELYKIDDEAIRSYYVDNKDKFLRDKLYRLYAVKVSSKKRADELAAQLREEGNSIRMMSARFSEVDRLARDNGEWELFSPDVMHEPWKADVMAGLPGEILGPYLDSDNFYTIIEIAGFAYKRHLSLNLAGPLIVEELIARRGGEKWDEYQNGMMSEYGAKINVNNLNWER